MIEVKKFIGSFTGSVYSHYTHKDFRHRTFHNFVVNLLGGIAAYCFFPKKPKIDIVKYSDNQLTLF